MKVFVDTPVWSEFFRRAEPNEPIREALRLLVDEGLAVLIGPVRQELLSGLRERKQFVRLRNTIRAFPDEPLLQSDYENAADMFNLCRGNGVQGSNTDFLICAVARRLSAQIFTLDRDFNEFARVLPISLFSFGP